MKPTKEQIEHDMNFLKIIRHTEVLKKFLQKKGRCKNEYFNTTTN